MLVAVLTVISILFGLVAGWVVVYFLLKNFIVPPPW